jgi:hypothetical protein
MGLRFENAGINQGWSSGLGRHDSSGERGLPASHYSRLIELISVSFAYRDHPHIAETPSSGPLIAESPFTKP